MAIIGAVIAIVTFIGLWWWRVQQARDAAETVIDLAGKAKGAMSRAAFKRRTGLSVLAGVESPGVAAATVLYSLAAMKRPVTLSDEDRMDQLLERVCKMQRQERADALAFAAWAAVQVADTNEIVRRFMPLWAPLDEAERKDLIEMALEVSEIDGPPTDAQASSIKRLSQGLFVK